MKTIQSILVVFLLVCLGTITNAVCTDCAKDILEKEYKVKNDWPVLGPRPKVGGGPRNWGGLLGDRTGLQQWDIEHGGFQYRISMENNKDEKRVENFLDVLARLPIPYRKGLSCLESLELGTSPGGGLAMNIKVGKPPREEWKKKINLGFSGSARSNFGGFNTPLLYNLIHEISHICGYYGLSAEEWKSAIEADPTKVSYYGNTNQNEDLAEYGVAYAFAKYMHGDNPEALQRLREMTPNRFVSWEKTLNRCGIPSETPTTTPAPLQEGPPPQQEGNNSPPGTGPPPPPHDKKVTTGKSKGRKGLLRRIAKIKKNNKDQDLVQVGESKSRNAGKEGQDLVQVGESKSRNAGKKDPDLVQEGESKSRNAGKEGQDLVQVGESKSESESRSESRDEKKCKSGNEKVK